MRILIVEDERPAAERLKGFIRRKMPEAEVVAECDSIEETLRYLSGGVLPDLAFFDIELADGQSLRIFEKASIDFPVVFTTAYDHYAVKAFEVNGIDYLLKPLSEEAFDRAIQRFRAAQTKNTVSIEQLSSLLAQPQSYRERFLVKTGSKLAFVPTERIRWFSSASSTTFLVTSENERFLLDQPLDEIEAELDPKRFFRINRGFIVSAPAIQSIESYFNHRLLLSITPESDEEVVVSRQRVKEFKQWLDH
jgi:DNA-binding LytR/AlgR family response regulator